MNAAPGCRLNCLSKRGAEELENPGRMYMMSLLFAPWCGAELAPRGAAGIEWERNSAGLPRQIARSGGR
jgi:hypothetical protein